MFHLILWIVWLAVLLILSFRSSQGNLLAPQIGFIAGFFIQAVYAVFYTDLWDLDFSGTTMTILFCGSGTFFLVSVLMQKFLSRYRLNMIPRNRFADSVSARSETVPVERWKLLVFLVLQLFVFIWLAGFIMRFGGADLTTGIGAFRYARRFTEVGELGMPYILELFRSFCYCSAFIWSYLLLRGLIRKRSAHAILLTANLILSVMIGLLYGGRGSAVSVIIAMGVQFYFIYGDVRKWRFRIPIKWIVASMIVLVLIIAVFQAAAKFLRGSDPGIGFAEYLAVYLSAELKNLDIFVREGVLRTDFSGWYTIADTQRFLGELFGIPSWIHYWRNPYRAVHGHSLGNVATTFYAPAHDGGVFAVVFFMALMAMICQIVFHKAKQSRNTSKIRIDIIAYSFIYNSIILSFFSNKFYENVVCPGMIKTLLSWVIIIFFIQNVRIRVKSGRISRPAVRAWN